MTSTKTRNHDRNIWIIYSPEIWTKSLSFNTSLMGSFALKVPPLSTKTALQFWAARRLGVSERRIVSSISHSTDLSPSPHGITSHLSLKRTDNRIICIYVEINEWMSRLFYSFFFFFFVSRGLRGPDGIQLLWKKGLAFWLSCWYLLLPRSYGDKYRL